MLVNLLRRRYACTDNTVFRIKFTYYNTGYYHQQFWNMIDEKTSPCQVIDGPDIAGWSAQGLVHRRRGREREGSMKLRGVASDGRRRAQR